MRSEWLEFMRKELKKNIKVEVLHRNEIPGRFLKKNYKPFLLYSFGWRQSMILQKSLIVFLLVVLQKT